MVTRWTLRIHVSLDLEIVHSIVQIGETPINAQEEMALSLDQIDQEEMALSLDQIDQEEMALFLDQIEKITAWLRWIQKTTFLVVIIKWIPGIILIRETILWLALVNQIVDTQKDLILLRGQTTGMENHHQTNVS